MGTHKQNKGNEQDNGMKVQDFIKQLQEEVSGLSYKYKEKEDELAELRKKQLQLGKDYKKTVKKKRAVDSGKAYLHTVNEMMGIETEEGFILRDMRDLVVETEIIEDLLTAYEEYIKLRKSK